MPLTTPEFPEFPEAPPSHNSPTSLFRSTQEPTVPQISNKIPRIYESTRRNDYCAEFECFKRTFNTLRICFPNSPIVDYQMSDWLEHRIAMTESYISELKGLIAAAETKASLKKAGEWVQVKNYNLLGADIKVGGWRERYGTPRNWHEDKTLILQRRTEGDDNSSVGEGIQAGGNNSVPEVPVTVLPLKEVYGKFSVNNQPDNQKGERSEEDYTFTHSHGNGYENEPEGIIEDFSGGNDGEERGEGLSFVIDGMFEIEI